MEKQELYLKTMFCCISCDGDIATEEVDLIRQLCNNDIKLDFEVSEKLLNQWIDDINKQGVIFLSSYLNDLKNANLSNEEQMNVVRLAIRAIEADNKIEYSEIKFFKKIRARLNVGDEQILEAFPDKQDFLLPDLNVLDDPILESNLQFDKISLL